MKTRTISAIVAALIAIPFLILGGIPFRFFVFAVSIICLKEFLDMRKTQKTLPLFIEFISYFLITMMVFANVEKGNLTYALDLRLLTGYFIALLFPVVLYHDKKIYNVDDAFYLLGGIFFLGTTFYSILLVRFLSLKLFIYLLLIACFTDMYSYFTGRMIGRIKLLEIISPKKTLEGMIGGTFFGTVIPTYFFHIAIHPYVSISKVFLVTLFLSLLGQFGDLTFSSIKRYYGKKDFSNLMPGHGGLLDRFDSLIFIALGFMFFIKII